MGQRRGMLRQWFLPYFKKHKGVVALDLFCAALTTLNEIVQRIRPLAEDESYRGDCSVNYFKTKLDRSVSEEDIREAMNELVRQGGYEWYKTLSGEDAIRKKSR